MGKNKWILITLICLVTGLFLFYLGIHTAFDFLNNHDHLTTRIQESISFFILSFIILFTTYQLINKHCFGAKSWVDIANESLAISKMEKPLKYSHTYAIIFTVLFLLFVTTPFLFKILFKTKPIYHFSLLSIFLICLVIYPFLVSLLWNSPKKAHNAEHRKMLKIVRLFIPALVSSYFVFYVEISAHFFNFEKVEYKVFVRSVSGSRSSVKRMCNQRVSGKNSENLGFSFCIDNTINNLRDGNVVYIDDGFAIIEGRIGALGSVVDSITWYNKYTYNDRVWSKEKQKYIYK